MMEAISPGGLPAGVRQIDCDGHTNWSQDAGETELWEACAPEQRETIVGDFSNQCADELRDALLDAMEAGNSRAEIARLSRVGKPAAKQLRLPPADMLGRLLWRAWAAYRDENVEALRRRGQIRAPGFSSSGSSSSG